MRQRDGRLPLAWLAGSVLFHTLALVAVPHHVERRPSQPEMLRVTIEKSDPQPRVATPPERPAARAAPTAKPPPKPQIQAPREQSNTPPPRSSADRPPREILSVPQSAAEPQFSVPAAEKPAEPPREPPQAVRPPLPSETAATTAVPRLAPPRVSDAYVLDSPVRYPRTAEHGRVTLKVLVGRDGRASNVSLDKASGHASLDRHAVDAVRRWRFAPARQGGETVEQWLTVNVDY